MYSAKALAVLVAPFLLAVHAKVDFDTDDAPNECKTICRPVGQLSNQCDVDLRSDNDRDEHRLESQCICTNKSFDVAKIAALCADCMHQSYNRGGRQNKRDSNRADRDDLKDIDRLMSTCGFSSTSYAPGATGQVQSITVSASKLTDISQLTTTLTGGGSRPTGSAATATGSVTRIITRTDSTGGVSTVTTAAPNTAGQQPGSQTTTSAPRSTNAAVGRGAAADVLALAGAGAVFMLLQ